MSIKRAVRHSLRWLALFAAISSVRGYNLIKQGTYVGSWNTGSIAMQIKLPTSPLLTDGTSQAGTVQAAMQSWNQVIGAAQFVSQTVAPGPSATANSLNEISMQANYGGASFGSGVLAVTLSSRGTGSTQESDIIFNSSYTWDSYRGPLNSGAFDLRRVALHELGHVLGLDHPDDAGQSIDAIMNRATSDIDALQPDDIAGAQFLYGAPGSVPSNDQFAQAIAISSAGGLVQVGGGNIGATKEAGEPLHANDAGGHSVWWKWTAPGTGSVTIRTAGSNFDTTLGVYTGSSVASLTRVAANDDESLTKTGIRTSSVTFSATSGTTYFIAVDGWNGYFGTIALSVGFGQAYEPNLVYTPFSFSTFAGSTESAGANDGRGSAARFDLPQGIAVDGSGVVYVVDYVNFTVRKISPDGTVTTFAGHAHLQGYKDGLGAAARFNGPNGAAIDRDGNLYVADTYNYVVRKITPAGVVSTLAGAAGSSGHADGTGSAARFTFPSALAVDRNYNVYVADSHDQTIRMITPGGVVSTLAGVTGVTGSTDGPGATATFYNPSGIAVDGNGVVFVADFSNNTIRRIGLDGVVSTFAGTPGVLSTHADGQGAAAGFGGPSGLAIDASGKLFVTEVQDVIRKITSGAVVTTLAGSFTFRGSTDGPGSTSTFNQPGAIAVDASGQLYISDTNNNTIRKIDSSGVVSTLAGRTNTGSADGTGDAAQFSKPIGIAVGADGVIVVGDTYNSTVRKISAAGAVTTLAGLPGKLDFADGTGSAAAFNLPYGVAILANGDAYVTDFFNHAIRKITPNGTVTTLAGAHGVVGSADGRGTAAQFNFPAGIAVDRNGTAYIADTHNHTIRKMTPDGTVTTLAGVAGAAGSADGSGSAARFNLPFGIGVDSTGIVYVSDSGSGTIRKITSAGVVTTLAGTAGVSGNVDRPGAAAQFGRLNGLAVSASGDIYVADANNNSIRRVTPDGVVTTLAGTGLDSTFDSPAGVAFDQAGNLYVTDFFTNVISKGVPVSSAAPAIVTQPASQTIAAGGAVTFTVAVSGSPAPSLQWLKNGVAISGAQGSSLSLTNVQSIDAGTYTVTASNSFGTATSAGAVLTVTAASTAPSFTTQPGNQTAAVGGTVTFTVAVSGSPAPTLQWFRNGAAIAGATSSSLTLADIKTTDAATYTAVATNSAGTATSTGGVLTVTTGSTAPTFATQPISQNVAIGGTVTFTVAVSGSPAPTFQWFRNGVAIGGATGSSLTLTSIKLSDAATYTVVVTNSAGTVTSAGAVLGIVGDSPPVISAQPQGHTMAGGSTVVLSVDASGTIVTGASVVSSGPQATAVISDLGLSYQWTKNGLPISGANLSQLKLSNLQAGDAGSYAVTVTSAAGSITSAPAVLSVVVAATDPGRLINLSVRIVSGTDDQVLIMGFVLGGAGTGGAKPLFIRGVGPTLVNYGVPNVMLDPLLEIIPQGAATATATNDNWGGDVRLRDFATATGAFPLPDAASKDAALGLSLAAGAYSAKVSGTARTTGTVLAELYDAEGGAFSPASPRLINVSARATMANDNPLIAGFVIGGTTAKTLMIRAVGPSLSRFSVSGAMSDPRLELYVRQAGTDRLFQANDDWAGSPLMIATAASVGAFALPDGASKDAAVLITLDPGIYSAKIVGVGNASGVVLVEIYEVP